MEHRDRCSIVKASALYGTQGQMQLRDASALYRTQGQMQLREGQCTIQNTETDAA
jgi:hypothetical protein